MDRKLETLDDYVLACLSNGAKWTFWTLQEKIQAKTGRFYGEPTISQAIRNIRKQHMRAKYNLPDGEVVLKERIPDSTGYYYKLHPNVFKRWSKL